MILSEILRTTIYNVNAYRIEEFEFIVYNSNVPDKENLLKSLGEAYFENNKYFENKRRDSLNVVSSFLVYFDKKFYNYLNISRNTTVQELLQRVETSDFWYIFFYFLGTFLLAFGYIRKKDEFYNTNLAYCFWLINIVFLFFSFKTQL